MTEIGEHYCSACGTQHGGHTGKDAEVRIAEIQAKRDVEVARIQRGEVKAVTELEAETAIAVTELEAAAAVAVAEETDPVPEGDSEDGNQSIIVEGPPAEPAPDEPEPSIEPSQDVPPDHEPETKRKKSAYWGQ